MCLQAYSGEEKEGQYRWWGKNEIEKTDKTEVNKKKIPYKKEMDGENYVEDYGSNPSPKD